MRILLELIRLIVTVVVLVVWTALGPFLWIPLLVRMTAYFMGMVVLDSFTRRVDISQVQNRLNFAIEFYVYGFRRIAEVMERGENGAIDLEPIKPVRIAEFLRSILLDVIWTLVFWAIVFAIVL